MINSIYVMKELMTQFTGDPAISLFMRIAMGLSFNEKNPNEWAKILQQDVEVWIYRRRIDERRFWFSSSRAFQLLSDGSAGWHGESIAKSVYDVMLLSKIGSAWVSLTKLRAAGFHYFQTTAFRPAPPLRQDRLWLFALFSAGERKKEPSASIWRTGNFDFLRNLSTGSTMPETIIWGWGQQMRLVIFLTSSCQRVQELRYVVYVRS